MDAELCAQSSSRDRCRVCVCVCVRLLTTHGRLCPAGSLRTKRTFARARFTETTRVAAICPSEVVRAVAPCGRCKIVAVADTQESRGMQYLSRGGRVAMLTGRAAALR